MSQISCETGLPQEYAKKTRLENLKKKVYVVQNNQLSTPAKWLETE